MLYLVNCVKVNIHAVKENHGTIPASVTSQGIIHPSIMKGAPSHAPWYIIRYSVLSKQVSQILRQYPDVVFFPLIKHQKLQPQNHQTVFVEKPIIPGYIFVHMQLSHAMNLSKILNLHLWQKRIGERLSETDDGTQLISSKSVSHFANQFHKIPHTAMQRFMQIVSYFQNDIELYDATDIDVEQNDLVEFITGPLQGQRGFIRLERRKSGGLIILPLTSSAGSANTDSSERPLLHFGIQAKPHEYRIVRFANNTRNSDTIRHANIKVSQLLATYCVGTQLSDKDRKCLKALSLRYADAQMDTLKQRTAHALLMLRIFTLMQDFLRLQKLSIHIETSLLPALTQHIVTSKGVHKERAMKQRDTFIQQLVGIAPNQFSIMGGGKIKYIASLRTFQGYKTYRCLCNLFNMLNH